MALPLFAITLFVSAFLLFLVQPLIGKMILPNLGGTPQVWNTCMVFFQTVLLLGYAYTHTVSTKLAVRKQIIVHGIMLLIPLAFILPPMGPFNIGTFQPPHGSNPIWVTLWFLAMVVGVPFFVVSTSAPLLQKWFSTTGHPSAQDPYFLYGASNLGSLLSLVSYPFLVEPFFRLLTQSWIWTVGFFGLAVLVITCMMMVFKNANAAQLATVDPLEAPLPQEYPVSPTQEETAIKQGAAQRTGAPRTEFKSGPAPVGSRNFPRKKGPKFAARASSTDITESPAYPTHARTDAVTWGRRIRWILLAAIPSSLMLGVTSYVSTDLSPFPLIWVIPLALYLLTFILVFAKWPVTWTGVPHDVILFIQPFALLMGTCLILLSQGFTQRPLLATFASWLGFFITTLMCHGELARDRPTPEHLTEFFLAMSFGGMLGGLFNGIIAPLIFSGVVEYPLAIMVSCFLRPRQKEGGWTDELVLSNPGVRAWAEETSDELSKSSGRPATHTPYLLHYGLDILLGASVFFITYLLRNVMFSQYFVDRAANDVDVNNLLVRIMRFVGFAKTSIPEWYPSFHNFFVFGIPFIICLFFTMRPLRFGLAVSGLIIVTLYLSEGRQGLIYSDRTYFGVIKVMSDRLVTGQYEGGEIVKSGEDRSLLHGTTDFGHNYVHTEPKDYRRLATMYYHRLAPLGFAMERFNWFPGPQNTYWGDARMPASIVGSVFTSLGVNGLPLNTVVETWNEPAFAVIGLGTGTMASYARPFQHLTYYEIDNMIRGFSIPEEGKDPYFYYLQDAITRGSKVEVIMGDARQSLKLELPPSEKDQPPLAAPDIKGQGYALSNMFEKREKYYKTLVVDAFSSDAIPIHLITLEAIKMYFDKLSDDGVLCVHTSNRHLDLVLPVIDIANKLGKKYLILDTHDLDRRNSNILGFTGSEYIFLANDEKYLVPKMMPNGKKWPPEVEGNRVTMSTYTGLGNRLWTDDYSNIVSVLNMFSPRRGH